jgi:RNA-directed DNA polymerase
MLSNVYLNEVDRMLERAKTVTRDGKYTRLEYARFADDLVILVDAHPRHAWLLKAVEQRLREELATLAVEVNEEKTRIVDLTKGECFGFLGFDFRRVRTLKGAWRPQYTPKLKKRTALLRTLKSIFRRSRSQPVREVIQQINPILRGWVNYFAAGHASQCFMYIHDWVERKVRRHLTRNAKRRGCGWRRWRRAWLHGPLGLFDGYQLHDRRATAVPARCVS